MNAEQRAMFAALDPLSSLALADSFEEVGDDKTAKRMRARAEFGRLFFEIIDATFPKVAVNVTHIHSIFDVTIYSIRTPKRITMQFVRPISAEEVEFQTWYIKPREAVIVSIDTVGLFRSAPDLFTAALHARFREKMNEMFAFVVNEATVVNQGLVSDVRAWHHTRQAAKRKAWIT